MPVQSIIEFRTLISGDRKFSPDSFRVFSSAVISARGIAATVIHPRYIMPFIDRPALVIDHPEIQDRVNPIKYAEYLFRLENMIRTTRMPLFIFSQERDLVDLGEWAMSLHPMVPAALVPTRPKTPTPFIDNSVMLERGWGVFKRTVRDLGVSSFVLSGEIACEVGDDAQGCVHFAARQLSYDYRFRVEVDPIYTYPNIYVAQ